MLSISRLEFIKLKTTYLLLIPKELTHDLILNFKEKIQNKNDLTCRISSVGVRSIISPATSEEIARGSGSGKTYTTTTTLQLCLKSQVVLHSLFHVTVVEKTQAVASSEMM